jgi:hypothetical protein
LAYCSSEFTALASVQGLPLCEIRDGFGQTLQSALRRHDPVPFQARTAGGCSIGLKSIVQTVNAQSLRIQKKEAVKIYSYVTRDCGQPHKRGAARLLTNREEH